MHRKTAAVIACLFLSSGVLSSGILSSGVALAQDRGTEADQEACTPDVFRLCSSFIPDEGKILACLQTNRLQLSAACGPVIFPPSHKVHTAAATPRRSRHHRRLAREAAN